MNIHKAYSLAKEIRQSLVVYSSFTQRDMEYLDHIEKFAWDFPQTILTDRQSEYLLTLAFHAGIDFMIYAPDVHVPREVKCISELAEGFVERKKEKLIEPEAI